MKPKRTNSNQFFGYQKVARRVSEKLPKIVILRVLPKKFGRRALLENATFISANAEVDIEDVTAVNTNKENITDGTPNN